MLKKALFQLHWFFGITAGLILSIMGITGALYSYHDEILKTLNPDSFYVEEQPATRLRPVEIYQLMNQRYPDRTVSTIQLGQANDAVIVTLTQKKQNNTFYLNPYTGDQLPAAMGEKFLDFALDLHRSLTLGEFGKQLTGASTLILLFFIFSGLYMRWPKKSSFKEWFAIKWQLTGRNFLWHLHAIVGTWALIFYVLIALTGLYWSYNWYREGIFKIMGVESPAQKEKIANTAKIKQAASNQNQQSNEKKKEPAPAKADIARAIDQSWQAFQQQVKDYSQVNYRLQRGKGKTLDIIYLDANPSSSFARNTIKYNVKQLKVDSISRYDDKPLNEKIMSSMLPIHRGIFFGPIWQFLTMLAALIMPLFFITGWMLYLKRRKEKKQVAVARQAFEVTTSHSASWLIVYASQTGMAEQLAWHTSHNLQQINIHTRVMPIDQLTQTMLQQTRHALFVVSSYGQGAAPDHARLFEKKQLSRSLDLQQLSYAVLALGDQQYQHSYCGFGIKLNKWLQACQAFSLFDLIKVNNGDVHALALWQAQLSTTLGNTVGNIDADKVFDRWTLTKREHLNPRSQGVPAFLLEFAAPHDANWHAGDIAEIQPGNDDQRIQTYLAKRQLNDQTLVRVHGQSRTLAQALRYLDLTKPIEAETAQQYADQLPPLPSREYSIASMPEEGVLKLVVRQKHTQHGVGLGSGWLTQLIALNQAIPLRIRNNESFHAPTDDRPLILIGNGTGIAGLRSILKQRELQQHHHNWLIFGERQAEHDFFFREDIQYWQQNGHIEQLNVVFSRDQAERIYVQHCLAEQAEQLRLWVGEGAAIYVCGSLYGMAADVDALLLQILGEAQMDQLMAEQRYRRDVY